MPPIGFPSSLAPPTAPLFARGSILLFSQYFKSLLLAKKIFCCCIVCQKINNGSHFSLFRRKLGTCKSQLFNFINSSCFFHTSYVSRNRKLHFFFLCQELSCARHIFVWKWLRLEYFDQYLYTETCDTVLIYLYHLSNTFSYIWKKWLSWIDLQKCNKISNMVPATPAW